MSSDDNITMTTPKTAFLWESYGPYHFARLDAARTSFGKDKVLGIEISPTTTTYGWQRGLPAELSVVPLVFGQAAEQVSGFTVYRRIRSILKEHKIEVLFIPSYWPFSSFMALLAAKHSGIRAVMMNESHLLSGRNSLPALAVKRRFVHYFDAALIGGSVHRQFFRQLGMPNERIFDGYDIVDNGHFKKIATASRIEADVWRAKLKLPERFVLSLGRFVRKKNLTSIVEAYALARKARTLNGHDLVFVGDGPEKTQIVAAARNLGLTVLIYDEADAGRSIEAKEIVRFYPFAQIDTTPVFYALASGFILASHVEEWGLVVNEAMASGCAVLVSMMAGCASDLVVPGRNGWRFHPGNPEELAWLLAKICGDAVNARQLGTFAQEWIQNWSGEQFGKGALGAAIAAINRGRESEREPRTSATSVYRVCVVQTCFPDYREALFDEVSRRLGDRFTLVCGRDYFTPGVVQCTDFKEWQSSINNTFLWFRNLLWQHSVIKEVEGADVVVLELNPRILTNWWILINRRLLGAQTLMWGHVWAREGISSWTNGIRIAMMRLSNGIVPYTHTQAAQLAKFMPKMSIIVAPNSLIPRSHCRSNVVTTEEVTDAIFVGRMIPDKKPMLLLNAFIIAAGRLPENVRLIFIGAGTALQEVRSAAARHIYGGRVVFGGHILHDELLRAMYARAFCSVSPGYVGLSAVQSFAYGVPMIVAQNEQHSPEIEACCEGFNTVFVRSNDPLALADALVRMWQERAHWLRRREELSKWTADNYSTEAMIDGFTAALDKTQLT